MASTHSYIGSIRPARLLLAAAGLFLLPVLMAAPAEAQTRTYDQELVGELLDRQGKGPMPRQPVRYRVHTLEHGTGNSIRARHQLYTQIGDGDPELGYRRITLTLLLNGRPVTELKTGDRLVIPSRPQDFDLDPLAFAPFPLEYPGARALEKLVVVDKDVQSWGAYENGRLVRWGPVSTGAAGKPTPTGRFNMNWRELDRISSESPEGQEWHMRYVMNIHNLRGIHLHQYDSVPTGPPVGSGCIRLVMADARWLWEWSEPWTTTAGRGALVGDVIKRGTPVIVQGSEPKGAPQRFVEGRRGAERVMVRLPADPMAVPRGDR
jgi:hypothetical protein